MNAYVLQRQPEEGHCPMETSVQRRFQNWLYNRLIAPWVCRDDIADVHYFVQNNGHMKGNQPVQKFDIVKEKPERANYKQTIDAKSDFLLEEMYSVRVNKAVALTEYGEDLVKYIRSEDPADFEPVWSSTGLQSPAELLLPAQYRLLAETIEPPITIQEDHDEMFNVTFKNNLFAVYGKCGFFASTYDIDIVILDSIPKSGYVRDNYQKSKCAVRWSVFMTSQMFNMIDRDRVATSGLKQEINFIKVCKFFERDVLAVCTDAGLVLLFDLETLSFLFEKQILFRDTYRDVSNLVQEPLAIFRSKESCWSVDTYCTDNIVLIAVGHNGPGVSLFAFSEDFHGITPCEELPSNHNVPCVTFIPNDTARDQRVTLAYTSIYGNVATVEIRLDTITQNNIDVEIADIQFLASPVWTVIPLKKKHFKKVAQFELLNLNFQESFKRQTLRNMVLDSSILEHQPPSLYNSGELGIGTLTTQLNVPVADLSLRCQMGVDPNKVHLRFTTFDTDGNMTAWHSNTTSGNEPTVPLDQLPEKSKDRCKSGHFFDTSTDYFYNTYNEASDSGLRQLTGLNICRYPRWFRVASLSQPMRCPNPREAARPINPANDDRIMLSSKNEDSEFLGNDYRIEGEWEDQKAAYDLQQIHRLTYCPVPHGRIAAGYPSIYGMVTAMSPYVDRNNIPGWSKFATNRYNENDIDLVDPAMTSAGEHIFDDSDYATQQKWSVHNHVIKIPFLLENVCTESVSRCKGYTLKKHENDFLLVTTEDRIYLLKPDPLIITSFTYNDIFPIKNVSLCSEELIASALNRINFVCHIPELQCVVVASQLGLVSLLRLTEYMGIYSFRQEYIFGWKSQDPHNLEAGNVCFRDTVFHSSTHRANVCEIDDVNFPYFNIVGLDYVYLPGNPVNKLAGHAILFIISKNAVNRIKIMDGNDAFAI
ncbi:Crt10p KNAG_0K01140 [Huiozyma naganishii CBS 8797]|uniref:Uncharacterized protein n=1 Tax=Huiozyma naganishii (strain ATCC MYA-139 / BCRC 22969 / CBS 8797 / KCTC 17520 / NBRC 10181 / NCYC 3082 / Yp74L-3) TaxID=1071383 RepID=J7SA77_HUIN7|nr:hypothetical protein KNAG_0K01140 [Kazachstania naganishii CBS 8797]CCK72479.1 hypothetical protein KNAG_0K01140 [Kazachstania naganishii CBS 8797]